MIFFLCTFFMYLLYEDRVNLFVNLDIMLMNNYKMTYRINEQSLMYILIVTHNVNSIKLIQKQSVQFTPRSHLYWNKMCIWSLGEQPITKNLRQIKVVFGTDLVLTRKWCHSHCAFISLRTNFWHFNLQFKRFANEKFVLLICKWLFNL